MSGCRRNTSLCSALLYESRIKAEFAYDSRKGVGACDRDPLGWECEVMDKTVHMKWESRETRPRPCVRRAKLGLYSFMQAGRVPGQSDILVAWPAEHVLVFRPAL